ncbi:MAG TPA: hypothetical protein DCY06_10285 [Bacteroidetes bacterium]|nr:hypothetical protein [Bacteroidota bacterium]HRJ98571.1 hypothetical protein [Ignavibacteria bacterium]
MRNRKYITFIINILTGIIFILPVYSLTGNEFVQSTGSDNTFITENIYYSNTVLNKANSPGNTMIKSYSAVIPHQFNFGKQQRIIPDNQEYSNFISNSDDFHNLHFRNINSTHGPNIFLKNISSINSLMTVRILC